MGSQTEGEGIDQAAVAAFMTEIAGTTPREMTRYVLGLEALMRRDLQESGSRHEISRATCAETLRRLRGLLIAEP